MKQIYLKFSMLLLCLVAGLSSAWANDIEVAAGTFNGKNAIYTTGWSTTGTGTGRTDCVIIGKNENITSPTLNLSSYDEVKITFTGRRFGDLTGSKATVDASIGGASQGTIDISNGSVGDVSGNISFTPTSSMTSVNIVFTCTNATNAGSTHGAGIGSITITGVKNNTEAYTVTFDAGENGTCNTESLTESTANAGITLPSCTPKSGYAFEGWSSSEEATSPENGLDAGTTYYPTGNLTLYAVYSKAGVPFTLVFKESGTNSDSSTKYATTDLSEVFSEGSDKVKSIANLTNVYPAQTGRGAKFGTSNATGNLTINLNKSVKIGKIVVECAGYASTEANGFTINNLSYSSTTYAANGFEELTYNTAGSIDAITIATQKKRGYVKLITVYPAGSYADLTVSAAQYATFYDSENAYTMPSDCKGYIWDKTKNKLVETYASGTVVTAGEPLVIYSETAGTKTLEFTTTAPTKSENNALLGTDTDTELDTDANSYFYGLSLGKDGTDYEGKIGFYWMNTDGSAFTNGAHKAYLKLDKSLFENASAPIMGFPFNDNTTAITNAKSSNSNNAVIYNLAGQRLNGLQKGINIINGKKVLNK